MEDVNCMKCHTTGFNPSTGVSKSYGVTCEACHSPIPADHPTKKMPVNSSTDMCEKCHSDSRFNWTKWQDSKHYQQDMKCVECHDPHSTSLQHVGTDSADNSALCIRCHKDDKKMSPDSVHGKAGISCIKCHLGDKKGVDEFHVVPDHSFKVDIATCDGCHVDQIHRPASDQPVALNPSPTPTPTISIPSPTPDPVVQSQPANESNKQLLWLTFAGITGLIGLVIGIAIPNLKLLIKPKKRS
jgi:predicted CXXCH cytochrome family protein